MLAFAAVFLSSALRRRFGALPSVIDVQDGRAIYDVKAYSLLDKALGKASSAEEKSYSMPLATQTFEKISRFEDGKQCAITNC